MPTGTRRITGLTSDYTNSLKEYEIEGQNKSLWEQFFTGTQQQYQGLSQQAQDVASYDISQAYANYKQQQLQLQMNEQLGAGFQQQAGQQLQSNYSSAYKDIKTKEAETIGEISAAYDKAIATGEKEFAAVGKQLRAYDELIVEWANTLSGEQFLVPDNFRDDKGNLTEEGKLWYYEAINAIDTEGNTFEDWLLAEESSDKYKLDEREAVFEAYKNNPALFSYLTTGLDDKFDYETAKKHQQERFFNTPMNTEVKLAKGLGTANSDVGDNFKVTYDGKTYKVEKGARADNDTQAELTKQYTNRYGMDTVKEGTIVVYKGELYIYIENNNRNKKEWNKLQGRKNDRSGMNALTKALGLEKARHTEQPRGEKGVRPGEVKAILPGY